MLDILTLPVSKLLPHGDSIVMLDRICAYGDSWLTAEVDLAVPGPLADAYGRMPAWMGLELMSQAVAAFGGTLRLKAGLPIQMGFLLGTRSYTCGSAFFPTSGKALIKVEQMMAEPATVSLFDCVIVLADAQHAPLAQAVLKVIQPDEPELLLQDMN